ncbi:MAG: hypothetical protein KatS3mg129_2218 [Leptospiraceae bacterium]|nr:MAG: hypothetical protein KatS3mg129_2218 [Leptospiraceae bacterium]
MKIKKLLIIIFILLFFLSSYFVYSFLTSPRYSIYKIQSSIQHKDKEIFLQYVDIDSIIDDFLQQMILEESRGVNPDNPLEHFKSQLKIKLIEKFRPSIKQYFKQSILSYFNSTAENLILPQEAQILLLKKLESFSIPSHIGMQYSIDRIIYPEQNIAIVEFHIIPENAPPIILKLKFIKQNFYWKLIAIPNLYEFLLKLNELKF